MDKTIVITGAGSGIGRACALRFLSEGWRVGLLGRRKAPLEDVAQGHDAAVVIPCDVADEAAVDAAFAKLAEVWGRIDVLFNNAGVSAFDATIDEIPTDDWKRCIDINVTGAFLCARAAFRQMRAQSPQGGRIINNGSVSSDVPRWGSAPYTTSKHAITGLTRSISLDGRPFGIACGQIDVGNALTEMAQSMTTGMPQADGSIAVEPVMDVSHVSDAVWHMASLPPEANVQFMTVMATNMPYIGRG